MWLRAKIAAKNDPFSHLEKKTFKSPGKLTAMAETVATYLRRWLMNSAIVSGASVSPTASLTYLST